MYIYNIYTYILYIYIYIYMYIIFQILVTESYTMDIFVTYETKKSVKNNFYSM